MRIFLTAFLLTFALCAGATADEPPAAWSDEPPAVTLADKMVAGYAWRWGNGRWEPCPVPGLRFEFRAGKWRMYCPCGDGCRCQPGQCPSCPVQTRPAFAPVPMMMQGGFGGGGRGGC